MIFCRLYIYLFRITLHMNFQAYTMKCKGKILIVDDNEDVLLSLNMLLRPWTEAIRVITDPGRIIEFMDSFHPDVILLDMNFSRDSISGEEGYEWLARILEHDPSSVVIFMTAYVSTEKTVRAIKAGAVDFVPKPWENRKMIETIHSAVDLKRSRMMPATDDDEQEETAVPLQESRFIGESAQILELKRRITHIAPTDANILITGENGSGKDVVAHEIHRLSARSGKPIVSIDLGCIPEALFESELFGHEKGAFTGATSPKAGRIEEANGGTLFLDEIGNLSPAMQQKLLTVIEKRETSRIGSTKVQKIDIRIVAATNADLNAMVADGRFREDLLYRINTIEFHLPPLRERGDDILLLANHFMEIYARKYNREAKKLSRDEERRLLAYPFPGNVRELQHCIERMVIDPGSPFPTGNGRMQESAQTSLNLVELERAAIHKALEQSNGNLSVAAELLGITRYALYRKIDKHGI